MNHQYRNGRPDDLLIFKDIKTRFDFLKEELHAIHEELGELHHLPPNGRSQLRKNGLLSYKHEVLLELRRLLKSADEVLSNTLERYR